MARRTIAVGQAGGPTAVINDTLAGVIYEARLRGLELIGLRNGFEGGGLNPNVEGNLIPLTDMSDTKIYEIISKPGAHLKTTRLRLKSGKDDEKIQKIRETLDSRGIECVFYIGGNDSADVIKNVGKGIHIAKTVDNDLPRPHERTPGYLSACLSNAKLIRAMHPDLSGFSPKIEHMGRNAYSSASVVVYQTQGRNTGWLTLGCALAKMNLKGEIDPEAAPHLFLPRETPYDEKTLVDRVDDSLSKRGEVFIVCSEELVDANDTPLSEIYGKTESVDSHGHTEHGRPGSFNYAEFIASVIKERIRVDVNFDYLKIKETTSTPNHISRVLEKSRVDAREAFALGRKAVSEFCDNATNNTNFSVGLRKMGNGDIVLPGRIPLEVAAANVRQVEKEYLGTIDGPTPKFCREFGSLIANDLATKQYDGQKLEEFYR
ncbi:MAG: 6-phosphofructokinase [archaeon]